MPVFFQHQINDTTRLGIWKIEETEEFFKNNVPQHRDVTHPRKRLQHLAGRFLLQFLAPDFPYELIQIAETRKPFLPNDQYHFSISHCGDFAAAIISRDQRVGIDIEIPKQKIERISEKFLSRDEHETFRIHPVETDVERPSGYYMPLTLLWSAKEAVFKWYGEGGIDFREHIHLLNRHKSNETVGCFFEKTKMAMTVNYRYFENLVLAWVVS
jgi:phosphopantetheinyl transferase